MEKLQLSPQLLLKLHLHSQLYPDIPIPILTSDYMTSLIASYSLVLIFTCSMTPIFSVPVSNISSSLQLPTFYTLPACPVAFARFVPSYYDIQPLSFVLYLIMFLSDLYPLRLQSVPT